MFAPTGNRPSHALTVNMAADPAAAFGEGAKLIKGPAASVWKDGGVQGFLGGWGLKCVKHKRKMQLLCGIRTSRMKMKCYVLWMRSGKRERREEEEGSRYRGGRGSMTDRGKVLWGMSNGPTGDGEPTQRQLRVKDDRNICQTFFSLPDSTGGWRLNSDQRPGG